MKRLFYLSVGVAAGVYVSRKLTRSAQAWTPAGLAEGITGIGQTVRELAGDVRAAAAAREEELRADAGFAHQDSSARAAHTTGPASGRGR